MSSGSFAHLHNHTDFSRLDGMQTVKELAEFAAKDEQPAVAITDHGNMSGYIQFEKACHAVGVKPIPGIEAYHVEDYERTRELGKVEGKRNNHMILLATDDDGYRNLMRMSSRAYLEQNYYKPLIDDKMLEQHTTGIVMTSGCLGSAVNQSILNGDEKKARDLLARYRDMVGRDRFFAEIQVHDFPDQKKANEVFLPMVKDLGIPLLATQDSHYASPRKAQAHEHMLAMQTGAVLSDPTRFKFSSHENYLATAEEMRRRYPEDLYPGACDNTLLIAEMVNVSKQAGSKYLIPSFPDAAQHGGEQKMLRKLVLSGCEERYGTPLPENVLKQVDYELGVIHEMGFDAYFLIVWDFVRWAKYEAGIYVGPGRGSAAGSTVSYALDITTLDPIKYGLFFERFLNPGRKSMPDIDIDFEPDGRAKVRDYLRRKYGDDRVAYIATQGKFHGRSAIKSAARIFEVKPAVANQVASTYPEKTKLTIDEMLSDFADIKTGDADKDSKRRKDWDEGKLFRATVNKGGDAMLDVVETAADVEGYINTFGKHAAAALITPEPLTNFVPLTKEPKDDLPTCGYDKDDAEAIGGLKMDLLGLINLTTIRKAVEQIKDNYGTEIDVNTLPLDDKKTFLLLRSADTDGVFQLASPGMKDLLRRVQPTTFEDLSALVALYRPGPMGTDMHYAYADRKNGRARVEVQHKDMLAFTEETYGLVVYQEQMLSLATEMAGFTAGEADTLRKATGKKDLNVLMSQEPKFKEGMVANGYTASLADTLWSLLPSFAEYSFNKAHSAAYGMVAYQTAWLKANYPAEYAAACVDTLDAPNVHIRWAKEVGVLFEVPDINESNFGARAFNGIVRLGLGQVKGLGGSSCDAVLDERATNGPFASLSDFLVRAIATGKVNKTALEALIEAGALDSLAASRGEMLRRLPELIKEARVAAPSDDADGWDDGDLLGDIDAPDVVLDFDVDASETLTLSDRLGRQVHRLGVFLGTHPMTLFTKYLSDRIPQESHEVSANLALGDVMTHGTVTAKVSKKTRRGMMHTVTLEAEDGYSLDVKVFLGADDDLDLPLGSLMIASGTLQEDQWAKNISSGDDDEDGGADEGESPRELLVSDHVSVPLAALDGADAMQDMHNIAILVDEIATVQELPRALWGNITPGLRQIVVITPEGQTALPQMVGETAEQIANALAHIAGVRVERF